MIWWPIRIWRRGVTHRIARGSATVSLKKKCGRTHIWGKGRWWIWLSLIYNWDIRVEVFSMPIWRHATCSHGYVSMPSQFSLRFHVSNTYLIKCTNNSQFCPNGVFGVIHIHFEKDKNFESPSMVNSELRSNKMAFCLLFYFYTVNSYSFYSLHNAM